MAMSADKPDYKLVVTILLSLVGYSGLGLADTEQPDMEFLEYLGSWEETDEDWLLFAALENEAVAADEKKRSDPAPDGEESTESDDES
jgi:hypothetical protein